VAVVALEGRTVGPVERMENMAATKAMEDLVVGIDRRTKESVTSRTIV
jgi:hypothetical protein